MNVKKAEVRLNIMDPEVINNPYPVYHNMREKSPIAWSPYMRSWVVTGYPEIQSLIKDKRFSSARSERTIKAIKDDDKEKYRPLADLIERWILFRDGDEHIRIRQLIARGFTPGVLKGLQGQIRETTDNLLDAAWNSGQLDGASDFAHTLPVHVIAGMLSVPFKDRERVFRWSQDLASLFGSLIITPEIALGAMKSHQEMLVYVKDLLHSAARDQHNDFLGSLIEAREAGRGFEGDDLAINMVALLFAGNETTRHFIGNAIHLLLRHPEQLANLLKTDTEEAWQGALEEVLRYESPIQMISRLALEDIETEAGLIKAGKRVFFFPAAGNRDPRIFEQPDIFDISRAPGKHLSFGAGAHYCSGANLARLEAMVALKGLFKRFPNIRPDPSRENIRSPNFILRGFDSLPLKFS